MTDFIPLNQRDRRWKNILLGWSTDTTIGSHGCLITCLAMLWETTPDKVNEWLKDNSGYLNLNLVDWTKVPGFKWRGWTYDNEKVKEVIAKHGACIVETDFDTNPKNGSHFVLFIGNKKLYDPWDGKEKPTNSFPVYYGYADVDPNEGGIMSDTMIIKTSDFERLHTGSSSYDQTVSYLEIETSDPTLTPFEKVQSVIAGIKSRASMVGGLEQEVKNRKGQVGRLEKQLLDEQELRNDLYDSLNSANKNLTEIGGIYEGRIKNMQGQIDSEAKQKGKCLNELAKYKNNQPKESLVRRLQKHWNRLKSSLEWL